MNKDQVAQLLMKAEQNKTFMSKLLNDPQTAASDLGIEMADNEVTAISDYVNGMQQRAGSGQKALSYPLPIISGSPGGKPKKPPPPPPPPKNK